MAEIWVILQEKCVNGEHAVAPSQLSGWVKEWISTVAPVNISQSLEQI